MASVEIARRLWAGLSRFAQAVVLVIVLETALKTRGKVLRFASTHDMLPEKSKTSAKSTLAVLSRPIELMGLTPHFPRKPAPATSQLLRGGVYGAGHSAA